MAARKPLVQVNGQTQQLQPGDWIALEDVLLQQTNAGTSALVFGMPVYASGADQVKGAQANAAATKQVIGFVGDVSVAASASGDILTNGIVTASATSLWDAIAGTTGGLTPGTIYYLSPTTPGNITATCPSTAGQYIVPLLVAISTLEARIQIGTDILL